MGFAKDSLARPAASSYTRPSRYIDCYSSPQPGADRPRAWIPGSTHGDDWSRGSGGVVAVDWWTAS